MPFYYSHTVRHAEPPKRVTVLDKNGRFTTVTRFGGRFCDQSDVIADVNVSQLCHVNLGHCLRGRESEVNEQNLLRVVIYCRELLKRRKLSSLAPAGKS